ncbi:helix-turn-helix domain-containing protein [Burkholderia alba]|uniref:helix-turn-helix domain-containing protein n=1 Tax=Burkholderia alba TaxID=2683677 RepID=UPI002B0577C5|nr:helix-turn-helix domain-containing protein [Burkholderia alba]
MSGPSYPAFHRLTTVDVPAKEQFDAWISLSRLCDFRLLDDAGGAFDSRYDSAQLGPFTVGGPTWLNPNRRAVYDAKRTASHVRTDGADFYQFVLRIDSGIAWRSESHSCVMPPGELYMIDMASPSDVRLTTGSAVSLIAPRDALPPGTERLHGRALRGGIAYLLGDYLRSLAGNLSRIAADELPSVVHATTQLLTASVLPSADALLQADAEIRGLLMQRVQRYIDAHLLHPGLNPHQISKDVGLSRSKLYQLFEPVGGVMREIRRKRLNLIHRILADPSLPRARIAELAWRHGFSDEKHFSRVFKAEFGYAPRDTLDRIRALHQETR